MSIESALHARVMEAFDVVEQIRSGFGQGGVATSVGPLALEHSEEAFSGSVVATMSDGTHAADDVVVD